jgi:polyhydroxybutyrate depolymerase
MRISVDALLEIVESSTANMWQRALTCLVLAACGQNTASVLPDASADAAQVAPDAGSTCGVRSGHRGKTERTLRVAGLDRTYIVFLPSNVDPKRSIPLVFVHHGYTMSGQAMFDITGYAALAEAEGIAVAFPDGQAGPDSWGAPWNVGTDNCPASGGEPPSASGNDFAMLDGIKEDIRADQCIDDAHVFVTGFSMGGYFSHHAGCMRPDIRAIAPHSGGAYPFDSCASQRKPVIIFHGVSDTIVPNNCSDPNVLPQLGVTPSAKAWAQKNGCSTTTRTVLVRGGACSYYEGCPADGQVAICTFAAMGHCWAGGKGTSIYACGAYEDATALEWAFFKTYAW